MLFFKFTSQCQWTKCVTHKPKLFSCNLLKQVSCILFCRTWWNPCFIDWLWGKHAINVSSLHRKPMRRIRNNTQRTFRFPLVLTVCCSTPPLAVTAVVIAVVVNTDGSLLNSAGSEETGVCTMTGWYSSRPGVWAYWYVGGNWFCTMCWNSTKTTNYLYGDTGRQVLRDYSHLQTPRYGFYIHSCKRTSVTLKIIFLEISWK